MVSRLILPSGPSFAQSEQREGPGRSGPPGGGGGGGFGGGGGGNGGMPSASGSREIVKVPGNRAGLVIGRGGESIKAIQEQSGAHLELNRDIPDGAAEKEFIVSGVCTYHHSTLPPAYIPPAAHPATLLRIVSPYAAYTPDDSCIVLRLRCPRPTRTNRGG